MVSDATILGYRLEKGWVRTRWVSGESMLQRDCAKAPWQREAGTARGPGLLGRARDHCSEAAELQGRAWVTGRAAAVGSATSVKLEQTGCAAGLDVGRGREESWTSRTSDLSS